jgi:SAM-dependent methyltransferase
MYHRVKKIVRHLFPRTFLYRYEVVLRYPSYLRYRGTRYTCGVCNARLKGFIRHGQDRICPRCGSIDRVRRLWGILQKDYLHPGLTILDFSPSRSLYRRMKQGPWDYTSTDLSNDFMADVSYDITAIDAPDGSFGLVLCYHILEHVPDDRKAMEELYRVLVPGGCCLVQTPFRKGGIYEDPQVTSPEERKRLFGQEDHVRIYSAEGLKDRLEGAGFGVKIRAFPPDEPDSGGLRANERILICEKPGG